MLNSLDQSDNPSLPLGENTLDAAKFMKNAFSDDSLHLSRLSQRDSFSVTPKADRSRAGADHTPVDITLSSDNIGVVPHRDGHADLPTGSMPNLSQRSRLGSTSRRTIMSMPVREMEDKLDSTRKENFSLKIRIYNLEKRLEGISTTSDNEYQKMNFDLTCNLDSCKEQLETKTIELNKALNQIKMMSDTQIRTRRDQQEDYEDQLEQLRASLAEREKELADANEKLRIAHADLAAAHNSTAILRQLIAPGSESEDDMRFHEMSTSRVDESVPGLLGVGGGDSSRRDSYSSRLALAEQRIVELTMENEALKKTNVSFGDGARVPAPFQHRLSPAVIADGMIDDRADSPSQKSDQGVDVESLDSAVSSSSILNPISKPANYNNNSVDHLSAGDVTPVKSQPTTTNDHLSVVKYSFQRFLHTIDSNDGSIAVNAATFVRSSLDSAQMQRFMTFAQTFSHASGDALVREMGSGEGALSSAKKQLILPDASNMPPTSPLLSDSLFPTHGSDFSPNANVMISDVSQVAAMWLSRSNTRRRSAAMSSRQQAIDVFAFLKSLLQQLRLTDGSLKRIVQILGGQASSIPEMATFREHVRRNSELFSQIEQRAQSMETSFAEIDEEMNTAHRLMETFERLSVSPRRVMNELMTSSTSMMGMSPMPKIDEVSRETFTSNTNILNSPLTTNNGRRNDRQQEIDSEQLKLATGSAAAPVVPMVVLESSDEQSGNNLNQCNTCTTHLVEIESLKNSISKLTNDYEEMQRCSQSLQDQANDFKNHNAELEAEKVRLIARVGQLVSMVTNDGEELVRLRHEHAQLKAQFDSILSGSLTLANTTVDPSCMYNATLITDASPLVPSPKNRLTLPAQEQSEAERLRRENRRLEELIQSYIVSETSQHSAADEHLASVQRDLDVARQREADLKSSLVTSEQRLAELDDRLSAVQDELTNTKQQYSSIQDDFARAKVEFSRANDAKLEELQTMDNALASARLERKEAQSKLEQAGKQLKKQTDGNAKLVNDISDMKSKLTALEKFENNSKKEIEVVKKDLDVAKANNDELKLEVEAARVETQQHLSDLEKEKETVARQNEKLKYVGELMKQLSNLKDELFELGNHLATSQSNVSALRSQLNGAESINKEQKNKLGQLETQKCDVTAKLEAANQSVASLEQLLETARADTDKLKGDLNDAQSDLAAERSRGESQRRATQAYMDELKNDVTRAQSELRKARDELVSVAARNARKPTADAMVMTDDCNDMRKVTAERDRLVNYAKTKKQQLVDAQAQLTKMAATQADTRHVNLSPVIRELDQCNADLKAHVESLDCQDGGGLKQQLPGVQISASASTESDPSVTHRYQLTNVQHKLILDKLGKGREYIRYCILVIEKLLGGTFRVEPSTSGTGGKIRILDPSDATGVNQVDVMAKAFKKTQYYICLLKSVVSELSFVPMPSAANCCQMLVQENLRLQNELTNSGDRLRSFMTANDARLEAIQVANSQRIDNRQVENRVINELTNAGYGARRPRAGSYK